MRHSETYRTTRREAAKKLYRAGQFENRNWPAYWFGINVPGKLWGRVSGKELTWGSFVPILPLWRQKVYRPIARALKGGALAWAARVQADNVAFARAMVHGNQPRR